MSHVKRASAGIVTPLARGLGVAAVAFATGCSSDVTRFAFLGDAPAGPTAYAPAGSGYQTGSTGSAVGVKETSLPPVQKAAQDYHLARDYPSPQGRPGRQAKAPNGAASADYGPSPWKWADRPPPKWSGQPLWTDDEPFPWPDPPSKYKPAEQRSAFQGHYTVRRGDTLPRIAQHFKTSLDELKRVNGIADASKVKVGTVLAIPARSGVGGSPPPSQVAPRVVQVKPSIAMAPPQPEAPEAPAPAVVRQTAAKHDGMVGDGSPQLRVTGGKFRWPVRGRVVTGFGPQPDGSKSDGVKLAAPMGTDIQAAEAGRVHYAGNGLKGYGNLILIRHANGWVSTYAHADKMLVKAGDEVKRGQVIGKVGKTGPVAQPQLGFELRKGSVPVDPLAHLAN